MKRGVETQQVMTVAGATRAPLADWVRHRAVTEYGYRSAGSGTDSLTFTRAMRPLWATVMAVLTGLTGFGLLFLLVRKPEAFRMIFEEDHTGLRLRVTGRVDPALLSDVSDQASATAGVGASSALFHDARGMAPVASYAPANAGISPHYLPPDPAGRASVPPPYVAARPVVPHQVAPAKVAAPEVAPPQVAPPQAQTRHVNQLAGPRFRLDSGERLPISERTLIGRNPEAGPGEGSTDLVAIVDPSSSVSKTHLIVGYENESVWVADRGSKNGTTVIDLTRTERPIPPGEWVFVEPGAQVRIGSRVLTLEFP